MYWFDYKLYQKGAVNSERFDKFIKEICKNVKNKLIILDNGQIHKKESTRKIIKDSGNFLLYTCEWWAFNLENSLTTIYTALYIYV